MSIGNGRRPAVGGKLLAVVLHAHITARQVVIAVHQVDIRIIYLVDTLDRSFVIVRAFDRAFVRSFVRSFDRTSFDRSFARR
jgi:hypothetical protein